MEQLILNNKEDEQIIEEVKKIILTMYPIVEDRLDILFSHPTPTLGIQLCLYANEEEKIAHTNIHFLSGNQNFKSQIPDRIAIDKLISINALNGIVEFILNDYDFISEISKFNDTIRLKFVVNMKDDNMYGISCGDIELEITLRKYPYQSKFSNQNEVLDYYMKGIVNRFHYQLRNTETYKNEHKKWALLTKAEVINSLTKEDLQLLLSKLSTEDICSMLLNIPDDRFCKLYDDFSHAKEEKKLIKQREESGKK